MSQFFIFVDFSPFLLPSLDGYHGAGVLDILHEPLCEAGVRVTYLILAKELVQMIEDIRARWTASARSLPMSFLTVAPFPSLIMSILFGHLTRHSFHDCGFVVELFSTTLVRARKPPRVLKSPIHFEKIEKEFRTGSKVLVHFQCMECKNNKPNAPHYP